MPFPFMAAAALGSTIYGAATAGARNKKQYEYSQDLMDKQFYENQAMGLFNKNMNLDIWQKTGPVGQVQQMNKAGLSPGLAYGLGGAGGATTGNANAQGVSGQQANVEDVGQGGIIGMQLLGQIALQKAQIANINADTKNKLGETGTPGGAEMLSTLQGIQNQKAQQTLTEVQTQSAQVAANIANATKQEAIDSATANFRKSEHELQILINNQEISDQTFNDAANIIKAQYAQMLLQNTQIQAQTNLTEQQIKGIINSIKQGNFATEVQANYPSIFNVLGKEVNDLLNGIIQKAGGGNPEQHRTENLK